MPSFLLGSCYLKGVGLLLVTTKKDDILSQPLFTRDKPSSFNLSAHLRLPPLVGVSTRSRSAVIKLRFK